MIRSIELIIGILVGVAYVTLGERKIMGRMQRRIGPDKVGRFGILQPIIDGIKLGIKEIMIPQQVEKRYYIMGPVVTLILALIIWIPIPIDNFKGVQIELENSLLYILAISSISAYILLYTGWASKSRYTKLGAIRGVSQIIAYEVGMGIIVMNGIIINNSLNLIEIEWKQIEIPNILPLAPIGILFIITAIAETNRGPFDLTEAESELVGGVLTEYGGMGFALMYMAEYTFILSMSVITSIIFWGGISGTPIVIFIIIGTRTILPRLRFDKLIGLGWTKILPLVLSYITLILSLNPIL